MKKTLLPLIFMTLLVFRGQGQVDSSDLTIRLSGYAETYYGYDFNEPADGNRPGFIYSHNRHNEFTINLAYLKAALNARRVRGNLALMAGTYANANLAAEPGTLNNVFEANAGVKLQKKHELWLDAGIFPSHIGFESAVGRECWTLTRSLLAETSPYYEAGAKLTYTEPDGKWLVSLLILNGWQQIQRVAGNSLPALGAQLQAKPNSKVTLNASTFLGTEKTDTSKIDRTFLNLYAIFQFTGHFGLTLGYDVGFRENLLTNADPDIWYGTALIARYRFNDRLALALRGEYYNDQHGVIIPTGTANGFQTLGLSANLDIWIHEHAVWRFEGKMFNSQDDIFIAPDNRPTNSNAVATTALAIWF